MAALEGLVGDGCGLQVGACVGVGQWSPQKRICPFTCSFPPLLYPCAFDTWRRKNTPNPHTFPFPQTQVMADASLTCYFEVDIVPYFRRVHAHVAATCATLADAIRHRARGGDQAVRAVGRGGAGRGGAEAEGRWRRCVGRHEILGPRALV